MKSIEFSTSMYEFSHGKKPRGIGCWAFYFNASRTADPEFCPGTCSLAEAKRWARARARSLGITFVEVAP